MVGVGLIEQVGECIGYCVSAKQDTYLAVLRQTRGEEVVLCALVGIGFMTSLALRSVSGGGTCQQLLGVQGWSPQGIVQI
jgi:hypothetical protein